MWEHHPASELVEEFSEIIASGKARFFLKYEDGAPVGFAQCQLRYLEGIFVKEEYRRKGYAKELLAPSEAWAMDFTETNRIICFTKKL